MKISPTRDVILIKADKPKGESESGILLAEEWKSLPLTGEVLAVGPDVTDAKVGDRVGFNRYASVVLEGDNRLINQKQLLWLQH
jgi:co-chaperonin GroES (HSP10)